MNENAMDTKLYAHEVGRYKRKVELLEKELERKREEIDAYKQVNTAIQGWIDLIVEAVGEVRIQKAALDEIVEDAGQRTRFDWDEESQEVVLRHIEVA